MHCLLIIISTADGMEGISLDYNIYIKYSYYSFKSEGSGQSPLSPQFNEYLNLLILPETFYYKMSKDNNHYAKDICKLFDISKATLFRWENEGLISNIRRDWRNWRIYSKDNIEEIKQIILSKEKR